MPPAHASVRSAEVGSREPQLRPLPQPLAGEGGKREATWTETRVGPSLSLPPKSDVTNLGQLNDVAELPAGESFGHSDSSSGEMIN
jgi:hypothetical protein